LKERSVAAGMRELVNRWGEGESGGAGGGGSKYFLG
jgi:hypothetical protein